MVGIRHSGGKGVDADTGTAVDAVVGSAAEAGADFIVDMGVDPAASAGASPAVDAGASPVAEAGASPAADDGDGAGATAAGGDGAGARKRSAAQAAQPGMSRSWRARATITRWRMRGVAAFVVIMLVGAFVGLLFFVRPTTSTVENRNLTTFPEFTPQSFADGSFFTDVSLWYADTYPLREPMVAADHAVDSLFGVRVNGGMVGGNVAADAIPVDEGSAENAGEGAGEGDARSGAADNGGSKKTGEPVEAPDERVVAADIQDEIMEGVYVTDGAAYSIYYFDQTAADAYVEAMNTAAENLDGQATVYSIMSPANSIMLPEEESSKLGGTDQQQTLDYLASRYDSRVRQVEIVDDIINHRDEYLYFYSDHHWTQLGAYYAYVAFCKEKGIAPHALDSWSHENLGAFHGSYYETVESMGTPREDSVDAYIPNGTNTMRYWPDGSSGEEVEAPVVDLGAAEWDPPLKYSCFIQGDQPLSIIENPAITDGSSCLVVKDSYGDAFVPLLVDSYQTVHVIDFRVTDQNICDYVRDNNIQDVIFLTGMKIGLTQTVATTLLSEVS